MTEYTTTDEEWRVAVGYDDYEISTHGRVRRIGRGILVAHISGRTPYPRVELKGKNVMIHRLVAETFIPNPDSKPCVDHIDGNAINNHISNLRWASWSENQHNRTGISGFKGVRQCPLTGRVRAVISVNHEAIHLGCYDTIEEAYHVYCAAAVLYHGDFACG